MSDILLKCTTRHVRLFTAAIQEGVLISSNDKLTMDLDPDNEFLWTEEATNKVQDYFCELVKGAVGSDLSDYSLRQIGTEIEGFIRQMLQAGELSYNPECRVLNYSMGLPRTPKLL